MPACILTIENETTVKFDNLDVALRRQLVKKFKKEIPNARFMPAVRLGRWDGCREFFTLSGKSYVNLLVDILPAIEAAGYEIELKDNRDYETSFEFEQMTEGSYSHIKWPAKHAHAGEDIMVRDHQVTAINDFLNNPQSIQCIATGAGKTLVTASLSQRCEKYGRTMVIVPNKSLVLQTERDYKLIGLDVGVWFGDRKELGHQHVICTWQSLNILFKNQKQHIEEKVQIYDFIQNMVAVIIDECHLVSGKVLTDLLTGPLASIPIRWGLTGTIPKEEHEQWSLLISIGQVIGGVTAVELQEKGILSNCDIHIRQLVDYGEYKDYPSEQKYLLDNADRMKYLASEIAEIAKTGNTLVLVDRIVAGEHLRNNLPDSLFLSGKDKVLVRKERYADIETLENSITIATYQIACVGIDITRLKHVVFLEPGKSFVRSIQSIGRGLRKGFDKDHVNIWDFTSTLKYSKRHLTKRKQFYREAEYPFIIEKVDWV